MLIYNQPVNGKRTHSKRNTSEVKVIERGRRVLKKTILSKINANSAHLKKLSEENKIFLESLGFKL